MSEQKASQAHAGLHFNEALIFEKSRSGRKGYSLFMSEIPDIKIDFEEHLLRKQNSLLPEVSELDVVRHFTRLSQWNFSIDSGFYPLGSCTMKYNPKVNEEVARFSGFAKSHPFQDETTIQGNLKLMFKLEGFLAEISGMDFVTLQPAAGAHGEFTGLAMIRAYHQSQGNPRSKVLIPDTAHGTNPASCTLCGYQVVTIKSNERGILDPEQVRELMDEETAAIMITNPNTLGLFEENIAEICEIVHQKGGLVYCDGANTNAIVGTCRVGDMGVDVLHFNLHKTFTTPHGGGGPGSGPVGIKKILEPFLPYPVIEKNGESFHFNYERPQSIGRVKAFYGNFGMLVRAFTYISDMGAEGLKKISQMAVLNANYVKKKLADYYHLPFSQTCMHECVFSDKKQSVFGIKTMDIAKRLMDYGFHPPTVYFPLIVAGALMIEPTETESKDTIDQFIEAMIEIAKECQENPELVKTAPHLSHVKRIDEVKAVKEPILTWKSEQ